MRSEEASRACQRWRVVSLTSDAPAASCDASGRTVCSTARHVFNRCRARNRGRIRQVAPRVAGRLARPPYPSALPSATCIAAVTTKRVYRAKAPSMVSRSQGMDDDSGPRWRNQTGRA